MMNRAIGFLTIFASSMRKFNSFLQFRRCQCARDPHSFRVLPYALSVYSLAGLCKCRISKVNRFAFLRL